MAVFFNCGLQGHLKRTNSSPHLLEWHPSRPLLAVASKDEAAEADGTVHIHSDKGELVGGKVLVQRSVPVECLQWHPEKTIVAVGWSSGEITLCNGTEHKTYEQSSVHKKIVVFVVWNSTGSRLISGDKSGLLAVWSVNEQGQPQLLHQHRMKASLTHCVLHVHPLFQGRVVEGASVLEAYSWKAKSLSSKNSADLATAFLCTNNGKLHYLQEGGECVERARIEGQPLFLRLHNRHQILAVVTHDMMLTQYSVNIKGETTILTNVKLSGKQKLTCFDWTYDKVLGSCGGEEIMRLWDIERAENYTLGTGTGSDIITCFSYNSNTGTLAAGTSSGVVVMWTWTPPPKGDKPKHDSPSDCWELLATTQLTIPLMQLKWCTNKNLLAAKCGKEVQILTKHVMKAHYNQQVSAMQVAPAQLLVECHNSGLLHTINTDIPIQGTCITKEHVAVWSGKQMMVYSYSQDKQQTRVAGSFSTQTSAAALHEMSILTTDKRNINICTFQGTVKQVLSCGEHEGHFVALTVSGQLLAAATDLGFVKIWDLSRREARLQEGCGLFENGADSLQIVSIQVNCTGSHVSILCKQQSGSPALLLLLWEVETDVVKSFVPSAFSSSLRPTSSTASSASTPSAFLLVTIPSELPDTMLPEQQRLSGAVGRRAVADHHWDSGDSRLLVVTVSSQLEEQQKRKPPGETDTRIVVLFLTPDLTMIISDVIPLDPAHSRVIGVSIPYICCAKKIPTASSSPLSSPPHHQLTTVARLTMKEYTGLETSDAATLRAMADFSFNSALGNMDEAFRAIKLIKSEKVWENMARMCVRSQRLDVAAVCLGNMGNAMAAKAVRESKSIPQPEARLAILAVHLNMLNEAEELYKQSGRHDLLNKFYQASGQWEKAMEEAERNDRMHLRTTYFNHARYAEAEEEFQTAITSYAKSGTHHTQVPRMLFDDPVELENYVMKSNDSEIHKWWAGYLESLGDYQQALQFYELARDFPSLVRVLCSSGNYERAAEIVEESGSKAAAYQLASRLKMEKEDVQSAIHFYTKAQCYSPAIQLAKEHGLDNELMKLALLSSQEDMMEAAKYYEQNPDTQDKAIVLYHKAGEMSRALELCFQLKQYEALHEMADDLSQSTSPEMVTRVAEFFSDSGHHEKAAHLLVKTRHIEGALDLCVAHNILITEEMAEEMTLSKTPHESVVEAERRVGLLERLADCCASQGSYHLATKKYTQGGDKTKAMKALLKSGDTEKIVFFAGVSRQRDVYVMAANYLQSLDWRKDPEIMKNIINFYTRGRALESLAGFYDACAQVEIDEYQDYQKAQGALSEALKCLSKAKTKNPAALEAKVKFLNARLDLIKKFAGARSMYATDPGQCVRECQALLDEPNIDTAVRTGDIYGLLIEHFAHVKNYKQAYILMEEMRQQIPSVNMAYYINTKTIETVYSALEIPIEGAVVEDGGEGRGRERREGREGREGSDDESVGEDVEER